MGGKMPCTHLVNLGDIFDYKDFKIKAFQTEKGWAAIIVRADGREIICHGERNDHYLTLDFTMTKEYAIKHARDAIDGAAVT